MVIALFAICMVNNISEEQAYSSADRAVTCEELGAFIFEP